LPNVQFTNQGKSGDCGALRFGRLILHQLIDPSISFVSQLFPQRE